MFQMAQLGVDTSVSSGRQGKEYVSGSEPHVSYPAAAGPWADPVQVPQEPSLGYAIDAQEPTGTFQEIERSIAASIAALSATDVMAEVGTAGIAPSAASPDVAAIPAISSDAASAERDQAPEGGRDRAHQPTTRGSVSSPTLHRPIRRL